MNCARCGKEEKLHAGHGRNPTIRDHHFCEVLPEEKEVLSKAELAELIKQAEQRGYERGISNERRVWLLSGISSDRKCQLAYAKGKADASKPDFDLRYCGKCHAMTNHVKSQPVQPSNPYEHWLECMAEEDQHPTDRVGWASVMRRHQELCPNKPVIIPMRKRKRQR